MYQNFCVDLLVKSRWLDEITPDGLAAKKQHLLDKFHKRVAHTGKEVTH